MAKAWIGVCSVVAFFFLAGALGAQNQPKKEPPREQRIAAGEEGGQEAARPYG